MLTELVLHDIGVLKAESLLDNIGNRDPKEVLETIKILVTGAEDMKLIELKEKAVKLGKAVLETKEEFAPSVFLFCDNIVALSDTELEDLAIGKIRRDPKSFLSAQDDGTVEFYRY